MCQIGICMVKSCDPQHRSINCAVFHLSETIILIHLESRFIYNFEGVNGISFSICYVPSINTDIPTLEYTVTMTVPCMKYLIFVIGKVE